MKRTVGAARFLLRRYAQSRSANAHRTGMDKLRLVFCKHQTSLNGGNVARPENEPKTPLGRRLRAVRRQFGDEDREVFAGRLGISRAALAYYERGERVPDLDVLAAYRTVLGINVNWLVGDVGEMFEDVSRAPKSRSSEPILDEWLFDELGKIVVREHKAAKATLPPEKVAPEAGALYNELTGMVRDVSDRRTVEAMLPLLAENLRERLRDAAANLGAGKREAS